MDPNPYAPPETWSLLPGDIVDRTERDGLAASIRRFLEEGTTAFQFASGLDNYHNSQDSSVRYVAYAVWFFVDDLDNHFVALSKAEWDYFQRLLLLLESDRGVTTTGSRRWCWTQVAAAVALLGFLAVAVNWGWGMQLLIAAMPFGLMSMAISHVRRKRESVGPYASLLFPFATFAELRAAYEAADTFKKSRYPRCLETRKVRSPVVDAFFRLQVCTAWLIFSPVVLLVQMFPQTDTHTRIVPPLGAVE